MRDSKTSKLNLFSFGQTEAAPDPEPTPAPITEAAPTGKKKYPPMSVYLTAEQRETVEAIAKATGQTKHAVLQYAVRKVCNDWDHNIWPEMEVKPKLK